MCVEAVDWGLGPACTTKGASSCHARAGEGTSRDTSRWRQAVDGQLQKAAQGSGWAPTMGVFTQRPGKPGLDVRPQGLPRDFMGKGPAAVASTCSATLGTLRTSASRSHLSALWVVMRAG